MVQGFLKYVFRKRQCVRSRMHGLGQVVSEGVTPLIRFLDGRECRVPADTLRFIPEEEFEAEIANRAAIDSCLIIRVHGREALPADGGLWTKDDDGIWVTREELDRRPSHPPGTMPYFMPDDLGDDARVVGPEDLPGDRKVVDCTVTRLPNYNAF
jgi:hypothetical protein